jgi:hypothetical protein
MRSATLTDFLLTERAPQKASFDVRNKKRSGMPVDRKG